MRSIIPLFFILAFLGILTAANIYLASRMKLFFSMADTKMFHLLFAATTVFMLAGMIVFTNTSKRWGSFLYRSAAIITGFMLYLLLAVLFVDLLNLFLKLGPQASGLLVFVLASAVSVYGLWNASYLRTTKIELPIKALKKEIKAMHISDVHIGHFRGKKFMQKIVDKTKKERPDLVFITGDLFDGKINLTEESLSPLEQLTMPVFFVEGNHDGYSGVKEIKNLLRNINVRVLENEIAEVDGLQIIGLDHMLADREKINIHTVRGRTIKETLALMPIKKDQPALVLHHSPDGIKYAHEYGIDLFLAGHTHAGQLFPINLITRMIFAFNRGLYDFRGTKVFVSEGVGTFGPPMRVGTKSEIVLITMQPA
jgi:uncharacterized protein